MVLEVALLPIVNLWKILVTDMKGNRSFMKVDRTYYEDESLFREIGGDKEGLAQGGAYAFLVRKEVPERDETTRLPQYWFSNVRFAEEHEVEQQRLRALWKRAEERKKNQASSTGDDASSTSG
jgi:hypothetical protein